MIKRITFLLLALSTLALSGTRRIEVDVLTSNSTTDNITGLNEIQTSNLEVGTVAHVLGLEEVGDGLISFYRWDGAEWDELRAINQSDGLLSQISNYSVLERAFINSQLGNIVDIGALEGVAAFWDSSSVDSTGAVTLSSEPITRSVTTFNSIRLGDRDGALSEADLEPLFDTTGGNEWVLEFRIRIDPNATPRTMDLIRSSAFNQWRLRIQRSSTQSRVQLHYVDGDGTQRLVNTNFPFDNINETPHTIKLTGNSNLLTLEVDGVSEEITSVSNGFEKPIWSQLARHATHGGSYFLEYLQLSLDGVVEDTWGAPQFSDESSLISQDNNRSLIISGTETTIDSTTTTTVDESLDLTRASVSFNATLAGFDTGILYNGTTPNIIDFTSVSNTSSQLVVNFDTPSSYQIVFLDAPSGVDANNIRAILTGGSSAGQFVDFAWHGGQSNAVGEGDARIFSTLLNNQLIGYNFDGYEFGTQSDLLATGTNVSVGADRWYGEAIHREGSSPFGVFKYAIGGRFTNEFYRPSATFGDEIDEGLVLFKQSMQDAFPNREPRLKFVYWDQVERDGGSGNSRDNLTFEEFIQIRNIRMGHITELYDNLVGTEDDTTHHFSVTNPDLVLFLRDIGDGQHSIGGGGVALSADITHPDYIIKADPTRTFNGADVNGVHVPYHSIPASDTEDHNPDAVWNGWMALRSAHQLMTDPSHGSPFYRPNIVLIDADGIGTRGDTALSGDGTHFGNNQYTLAERFITAYNEKFGESVTIAPSEEN